MQVGKKMDQVSVEAKVHFKLNCHLSGNIERLEKSHNDVLND